MTPPDHALEAGHDPRRRRRVRTVLLVVALVAAGIIARSLVTEGADSFLVRWLPWMQDRTVTVYFTDGGGTALVPVARDLPRDAGVAEIFAEMLEGPAPDTGLRTLLPGGTTLLSAATDGDTAVLALGGDPAGFDDPLVREAIRQSFTGRDGLEEVELTVGGVEVDVMGSSGHLLFFYDEAADMLLGHPSAARDPRALLEEFLAGPTSPGLVGLPADVDILELDYSPDTGLLSLDFTYQPSVRTFALDHPEAMRRVLEGLIATMTVGFPQIDGLYLDFEGRATLGLGQCADLLRTLQLQPEVLNDERLLARRAG